MLYDVDLYSLDTQIRDVIGEETARLWTQQAIFRAINAETARLIRDVIELDQGYFESSIELNPVSNYVDTPPHLYKIRAIEVYTTQGRWTVLPYRGVADRYITLPVTASGGVDFTCNIRFHNNQIYLDPSQATVTKLKVYYAHVMAPMVSGTATGGGSGYIALDTNGLLVDNAYKDMVIKIVEGTGAGQQNTITQYLGSAARWAYVDAGWSPVPDTSSVYAMGLPRPLDAWPEVVVSGAAIRLLYRRRDDALINMVREQYAFDYRRMMEGLKRRQVDQPPRVRYIPDQFDY